MEISFSTEQESGQALTEYIVLVAIVVGIYMTVTVGLNRIGLAKKLTTPLTTTFAAAYRYGHTEAKGYDDGGPLNHPRIDLPGGNNFRLFYNPDVQ